MPIHWIVFGLFEVLCFFYFASSLSLKWRAIPVKNFVKKLFILALIIRIVYVIFTYFFYENMTGIPFEFQTGDALGYHKEAIWINKLFHSQQIISKYIPYVGGNYSDAGYPVYLSIIYFFADNSILLARIVKAILSAYTCILIFKICKNNFGEQTAKIAGLLALLFPSFIYYCGLHVKETEMIFLISFFIERADNLIRNQHFSYLNLLLIISLGFSLFFFRTVVGISAFFALFSVLLLSKNRFIQSGKKIAIGIWVIAALLLFLGGTLQNEISKYWEDRETNQLQSMKARAETENGNKFSKYGASAVFAPFMLIAPFPTLVNVDTQQNQMMLNGGFFVKNIIGFFILLAIILLIKTKEYKRHILILSFLLVYLGILTLSKFAISERFHMPIYPILLIFTAFGISKVNVKSAKYYIPYLILVGAIIIGWNYFKLAGRGAV